MKTKERNPSIEIFRILSMFLILMHYFLFIISPGM